MTVCPTCFRDTLLSNNFGGICCRGCAAFFRRCVRGNSVWTCKQTPGLCEMKAPPGLSCKKCRYERCLHIGMQPVYVRPPPQENLENNSTRIDVMSTQGTGLPILDSFVKAMRDAYQHRHEGDNLSYASLRSKTNAEFQVFRHLLDLAPIIGSLDVEQKNQIFKNSISLYMCFIHNLSHSRQANRLPNKFYLNANFYIELDPHKLQHLFNKDSAITIPAGQTYFYELAEKSVKISLRSLEHITPIFENVLTTNKDLAALLVLLIIQTNNKFSVHSELGESLLHLKSVMKELQIYYQRRQKDPSFWGNLILLLSDLQTTSNNSSEIHRAMHLVTGITMFN
ncbi:hypothetical protein L596_022821 [Steinernema carpocapsae]|uniref:Nuclear receptor domain-containing protein n=1 Tax=Steinernema carpocapsae TaxID=34508 RepID=A0A4U5MMV2_STECR|nr:hypothetical protein L596_022821 [Steinernema carpocapsae]